MILKKLINKSYLFVVLAVISVLSANVYANSPAISFSVAGPEIPPFIYLNEHNQPKGSFVAMLKAAEQQHNLSITFHIMPWARAMAEVKNNRIDALMPVLYNDSRAEYLAYPNEPTFIMHDNVLLKRSSDDFQYKNLTSLTADMVIGKMRSTLTDESFDKAQKQGLFTIVETLNIEQAITLLNRERLDLVVGDVEIVTTALAKLKLSDEISIMPMSTNVRPSYLSFSKEFAARNDINDIVNRIASANKITTPSLIATIE